MKIRTIRKGNWYIVQRKFLFFWVSLKNAMDRECLFPTEDSAIKAAKDT